MPIQKQLSVFMPNRPGVLAEMSTILAGHRANVLQIYHNRAFSQARLGKGTQGLLEQTALHISKLQGGESVGGYPGFEPPGDDERYKNKIRDRSYSGEEANDWLKEINNYLKQVVKKNPNLTLEEILQRAGLNQAEIEHFLEALREVHFLAEGLEGSDVTSQSFQTLQTLMEQLGVAPWPW